MERGNILTLSNLNELVSSSVIYKTENIGEINVQHKYCINKIVNHFIPLIHISKREIEGVFTLEEACLICDALNGIIFDVRISAKESLIIDINDSIEYDNLDAKWKVNAADLNKKMEGLTECQALVVIILANEFWSKDDGMKEFSEIEELFGISVSV